MAEKKTTAKKTTKKVAAKVSATKTEAKKAPAKKPAPKKTAVKKTTRTKPVTPKAKTKPKVTESVPSKVNVAEEIAATQIKPVVKLPKALDDITFDEFLKVCENDVEIAKKIQQLIGDYRFLRHDPTERKRCVTIAFGNWMKHKYDFNKDGILDEFELAQNKHADVILKKLEEL